MGLLQDKQLQEIVEVLHFGSDITVAQLKPYMPKRYRILSNLAIPATVAIYFIGMMGVIQYTDLGTFALSILTVVLALAIPRLSKAKCKGNRY